MYAAILVGLAGELAASGPQPRIRQITFGPAHHFFGYIGHAGTIPWNASGRYVVALRSRFQDHMPAAGERAEIVLLDAEHDYAETAVESTGAWNLQQGTMLYWNPLASETQFIFNDRDAADNRVFAVLCDIGQRPTARRREYRFDETSVGNSGVSPAGGKFAAINYGRLARLRAVTGYADAADWTEGLPHPAHDGVFVVDIATGAKRLLASFAQMADAIRPSRPDVDSIELFINHTLWSPDGQRLFFFCRGNFGDASRLNVSFVARADGSGLTMLNDHIGGHPEWLDARRMIGRWGARQGVYDVERQAFVEALGGEGTFVDPEGDIALSPHGTWLANGASKRAENLYTFFRLADGRTLHAGPLGRGRWTSGDLRVDGAPCWNRDGTAVLTAAIADDDAHTRQLFLIELPKTSLD